MRRTASLPQHMATDMVSDETLAKVLARELTSLGCRNQGYILEGCLQTLAQAQCAPQALSWRLDSEIASVIGLTTMKVFNTFLS